MKKIKLLMPLISIAALSSAALPLTSCGGNGGGDSSSVLVTGVSLSDTNLTMGPGESVTLTATVTPSNATNKTLKWISSDESVATVSNGVVTAIKAGTVTISATSTDGTNISAAANITVKVISVTSITLTPNEQVFSVNNNVNITATVLPTNASNKALTWESDNTAVATVEDGVVSCRSEGFANITAKAADGSGVSKTINIEVITVPLSGISFGSLSYSVKVGKSITLTPTYTPYNASNKTITSWESSNTSVATVSNGIVQATNTAGTTTITAKSGDWTASTTVVVKEASEVLTEQEITTDGTYDDDYESTTSKKNAVLINGPTVTLENSTINKTGDSDGGDDDSFYGYNSALLAKGGAKVTLNNVTVQSNAKGGNGIFCNGGTFPHNSNGDGTTITATGCNVTTTKDNAGGYMTTGGGITNLTNCSATTAGGSSAAIRTDRGGGTVTVNGGTFKSTGQGSPAIYSTAAINVANATLQSTASEGVVVEGGNSVSLDTCTLTDNNNKLNGQSTTYKNIFLYQSMSGDASSGTSSFTAKNSDITTQYGDNFYVTNTTCTINLTNNTITNTYSNDWYFLRAEAAAWGTANQNGGKVTLNATNQEMVGDIYVDSISTLNMNMKGTSSYKGTINAAKSTAGCSLSLEATSTMNLLGDCYLTSFTNAKSDNSNITTNNHHIYVYESGNWVAKV